MIRSKMPECCVDCAQKYRMGGLSCSGLRYGSEPCRGKAFTVVGFLEKSDIGFRRVAGDCGYSEDEIDTLWEIIHGRR